MLDSRDYARLPVCSKLGIRVSFLGKERDIVCVCVCVCVCEREGEFCNRHRKFLFWMKRQQTNNQFNLLTGKCGLVGDFLNNLCLLKFHLASNFSV